MLYVRACVRVCTPMLFLVAAKKKYGDKFEEFDLHVVKLVKGDQGLGKQEKKKNIFECC